MGHPGLFFVYFWFFSNQQFCFKQINVKKCPSTIRRRDSNPRPFEHELSSPITTRPGLPPLQLKS